MSLVSTKQGLLKASEGSKHSLEDNLAQSEHSNRRLANEYEATQVKLATAEQVNKGLQAEVADVGQQKARAIKEAKERLAEAETKLVSVQSRFQNVLSLKMLDDDRNMQLEVDLQLAHSALSEAKQAHDYA